MAADLLFYEGATGGGNGLTDLLFYSASLGVGDFYAVEQGDIIPLAQHTGWRVSWNLIVPGDFSRGGDRGVLRHPARNPFSVEPAYRLA